MQKHPTHHEHLTALKRIEGQIKGIQKMIEEEKYCVDIITQLRAIVGAILRIESHILKKHIEGCVVGAFKGKSETEKQKKIDEVMDLMRQFRNI